MLPILLSYFFYHLFRYARAHVRTGSYALAVMHIVLEINSTVRIKL